ncbi:protein IQ-DOMAIN 9-like [Zingiber officinale]|uniref:protein IQ-DOMAIN 9-like n=1 Tax=Zingiber officinale TaxID=94328 RepID=UPI001C4C2804|nr:protein IQ-DOMAIN 9-like [Zingiber officinale]XP_042393018.1 protein IQ-DOMAIN 9-like [Zingiber officinale]
MGSGDWLKTIIHRKKTKKATVSSNSQSNGFKLKNQASDHPNKLLNNGAENGNIGDGVTAEDAAAIRIQTSFRRFRARKTLRSLRRKERLQDLTHRNSVQKQISNTLRHVQLWSKIQAQIRTRRTMMVVEGRIRQKKHENQLKLEAKLQDLEVEWNGGTETKEEIIARIQQREEAAVKRERAMAYAFSHQWRASSGINQGPFVYELAKGNWEWSWVDKWIAAQPWETRPSAQSQVKPALKANKNANPSTQTVPTSSKLANTDAKVSIKKPPKQPDEDTTLKIINTARLRSKCGTSKQEEQPSQGGELVT